MNDETDTRTPPAADMTAFARRHVRPEYLARMGELAGPVAAFGRMVRRPPRKQDAPASEFRVPAP